MDDTMYYQISDIILGLNNCFSSETMISVINKETKESLILNSLTNLVKLQIKINEKINNLNL